MVYYFILGAVDAEMLAIQNLLDKVIELNPRKLGYGYAQGERGKRILPGEWAQGHTHMNGVDCVSRNPGVFTVSIEVPGCYAESQDYVIDHHDPDDERTSLPAVSGFEASSIGQLIAFLAEKKAFVPPQDWTRWEDFDHGSFDPLFREPHSYDYYVRWIHPEEENPRARKSWYAVPQNIVFEGFADHNLAGAARILGPEFEEFILRSRWTAFAPTLTFEEFCAAVRTARQTLRDAPPCTRLHPEGLVADLRGLTPDGPLVAATKERYPQQAQFLPLAAALEGRGYIAPVMKEDRPSLRVGGCGNGSAPGTDPVRVWLRIAHSEFGCTDELAPFNVYGFPERGMGGGTLQ